MESFWRLVKKLNLICEEHPWDTTWYLKDLRTDEAASRGGRVVVASASTRKVSIMMAAFKAVNDGRLSLDQPMKIQAKYQNNTSGCFQHLTPGFSITLRDAVVMMIIVSDNTCTGAIADLVGLDEINGYCQAIGMRDTLHRYGLPPIGVAPDQLLDKATLVTADDQGLLLEMMLAGVTDPAAAAKLGVTCALCTLAVDIMSWQKYRTRLPSLLPAGTKVAHKTGTGAHEFNDTGIIWRDGQPLCILCCYTSQVPVALADGTPGFAGAGRLIGKMARAGWDALKPSRPVGLGPAGGVVDGAGV